MNASVRLAFCILVLMGCLAFLVTALQPFRELKKKEAALSEVMAKEEKVILEKDAKQLELKAIVYDPKYLEIIARDSLDYSKPGEQIFRIQRSQDIQP
jgi:cell division protein FtsB